MARLLRFSIRAKLTLLIGALLAGIALTLLLALPRRLDETSRYWAEARIRDVAAMVATAAAPGVEYQDLESAREILATLKSTPDALHAAIWLADGTTLTTWQSERAAQLAPGAPAPVGLTFGLSEATVVVPVTVKRVQKGTLQIAFSTERLQAAQRAGRLTVAIASLAILLLGVLGAVAIGGLVSRPIVSLTRVAERIVDRGDLSETIEVRSSDEVGTLASSFSRLVAKLREIPAALSGSLELLSGAVTDMNGAATTQNEAIVRQAAALRQTQGTTEEIHHTSTLAAQKAESVLKQAERASTHGKIGEEAVEQSIVGLADIRAQVDETARRITELGAHAERIGDITRTVKDLADQLSMIALNASIEAVRSGEQGKGFSVVAREIRSLADQSISATERVREILGLIASSIRATVQISVSGSARIEAGVMQVRASGNSLRELAGVVQENAAAVRQIAAAVSQQSAGVTQIFGALSELSKMVDENVSHLRSTSEAVSAVRQASDRVAQVVKSYHL